MPGLLDQPVQQFWMDVSSPRQPDAKRARRGDDFCALLQLLRYSVLSGAIVRNRRTVSSGTFRYLRLCNPTETPRTSGGTRPTLESDLFAGLIDVTFVADIAIKGTAG
jgi:hypothetical protein